MRNLHPHVAEKSATYEALEHLRKPEGWKTTTLESLISDGGIFVDGDWVESKDQDPNGDVRLIQLADVGDGTFRDRSERFLTSEKARELSCTFLAPDDLLVARMPDPLGRACIFPGDKKHSVTVVDVAVVRPRNSEVNTRWLMYCINSPQFRRAVASMQSGSTRQRISRKNLAKITFSLPPRRIQDSVVAEIEKQFSRMDEAVADIKRVRANLKLYRSAILAETTCVDRETLPTGWRWSNVGELAEVGTGATPKRDRADYWASGTVPWVASAAVNKAIVTEPTELITELALKETNCRVYPPGTLLVAMYGEGKTRGTCAELGIAAATNQALAAIQVPAKLRPYLKLVLQASYERTRRIASGGVQPNLNLSHVRRIRVPLPSDQDQRRIVEDVDRRLSVADGIASQLRVCINRAERLRQLILSSTFAEALTSTR